MDIELADVPKSEFEGVFAAIKQGIYPRYLAGMMSFSVSG